MLTHPSLSALRAPSARQRHISALVLCLASALALLACDDQPSKTTDPMEVTGGVEAGSTPAPVTSSSGLTLTAPLNGDLFTTRMVEVSGTHPTAVKVLINGQEVSVTGQRFTTTLTLDEGTHVIEVSDSATALDVNVMVDLTPPTLEIGTPAYGTHVDSSRESSVTVTGGASDELSGVDAAFVNGVEVPVDANGAFYFTYAPTEGLNVVEVLLQDRAGHQVSAYRSFLYGRFKEWSTPVSRALGLFATPYAFDALERAIVAAVGGGLIDSLLDSSVGQDQGVTINSVEYSELRVNLEPLEGYIQATITFNDLRVRFELDSPSTSGDIYVNAVLNAKLFLGALPGGALDVRIEEPSVELANFDLYVDSALIGAVTTFLESFIADFAEAALLSILEETLVGSLVDPSLLNPTLSVLNTELSLQVLMEQVSVSPMGLEVLAGLGLSSRDAVRQSPGYLFDPTPSEPEYLSTMASAFAQLNSLHMLLGQIWRGGLLDVNLLDLVTEPPAPLRAAALAGFTGGALLEHMEATDVVGVRLRPSLPPVARFEPTTDPSAVFVDLNDMLIDLTLPDGSPWVTLGLNLTARTQPQIVQNDLQLPTELSVKVWHVASPIFEVDTERLLGLLVPLLERLPNLVGVQAGGEPLIRFSELDLFGVQVSTTELVCTAPPSAHALIGLQVIAP